MSGSNPENPDKGFEQLDHAHTLAVVIEAAVVAHAFGQHLFTRMSKGRMSQIMRESDRFGEIFIQTNARAIVRLIDATSIECVRRVRKWSPVPFRKDLGLILQADETRVNELSAPGRVETRCETHAPVPNIAGRARRRIFPQTAQAQRAHWLPFPRAF